MLSQHKAQIFDQWRFYMNFITIVSQGADILTSINAKKKELGLWKKIKIGWEKMFS